jgi:precorrin-6B methylase 2
MRRLLWLPALLAACAAAVQESPKPVYETRAQHDPNGIGKFYMGREIAHVLGHLGIGWLERPEREREEAPAKLIEAMELKDGQVVADIGAGSGYFTFRIAPKVGPKGRVLAVDIQKEMLDFIRKKAAQLEATNVEPILGVEDDPKLKEASVDVALLVDVYHEFAFPYEMMTAIRKALKPGGRVVLVEYRAEDPEVPMKAVHKMTQAQAKKELAAAGLRWVKTDDRLPWQHIMIFERAR